MMPSRVLTKVPEITVYFWIVKILTTAMGEATSDYMVFHMNPYLAVMLGAVGFVVALIIQMAFRRYIAWSYWLLVVMVSIFGTMVADVIHIVLGVPYPWSTTGFAVALAIIFWAWYRVEGTLSVHSIYTRRRESFYWAMVIAAFALGTAAGDMTATTLHLGYFGSGVLFAVLFTLPGLCYWRLGLNDIVAFWAAYVLTRPLGASFADGFGKPVSWGGLGYGSGWVSIVLTALIVAFVAYLSISHVDLPSDSPARKDRGQPGGGDAATMAHP